MIVMNIVEIKWWNEDENTCQMWPKLVNTVDFLQLSLFAMLTIFKVG